MTNARLIEELEDARVARASFQRMYDDVDRFGLCDRLLEVVGSALIRADDHVHQLHREVEHRLNWEPRSRAW